MPCAANLAALTGPIPGIFVTQRRALNSSSSLGLTTNKPFGLSQSLATLAINLLGATPAEIVMPTSASTVDLISCAIRVALPPNKGESVTSINASSKDKGSMVVE